MAIIPVNLVPPNTQPNAAQTILANATAQLQPTAAPAATTAAATTATNTASTQPNPMVSSAGALAPAFQMGNGVGLSA
jgi:hypothetical protein